MDEHALRKLLDRAAGGHEESSAELMRQLGPFVLRAVRIHLPRKSHLRQIFDSDDIIQSVFADFFIGARAGDIRFRGVGQLNTLLQRMAKHKVIDKVRNLNAEWRALETVWIEGRCLPQANNHPSPGDKMGSREVYSQIRSLMTENERQIADLRSQGRTFPEIAALLSPTKGKELNPNTLRMTLERAMARIREQLSHGKED